ncbi:hypothetical protein PV619_003835 [Salmonella enterica]|nr:hypothetical protein [Salmonella enterica]
MGIELFLLQILGFLRKNSYQEENILENSDNLGSGTLQGCKAARLQGCKAARLQGCKAARLQGWIFKVNKFYALFPRSYPFPLFKHGICGRKWEYCHRGWC